MKIKTSRISNTTKNRALRQPDLLQFEIKECVMKDHFKKLMGLASLYDSGTKIGFIKKEKETAFKELLVMIESSNANACQKSHEKSKEKAKNRAAQSKFQSFEDYCDDNLDLHIALMTTEQKNQAFKSFKA